MGWTEIKNSIKEISSKHSENYFRMFFCVGIIGCRTCTYNGVSVFYAVLNSMNKEALTGGTSYHYVR